MGRIINFRGLLADNGTDTISLHTNNGLIGYKIVKFQLFANAPGTSSFELVAKIFSVPQTTTSSTVDFSEETLLAAAYYADSSSVGSTEANQTVIFDNRIFNQDIDITMVDANSTASGNYYIELEQVVLALDEATVATLKNIRNI